MTQEEKEKNEELRSKRMACLVYSRVCGWLAPTANFNPGKKAERGDRKDFIFQLKDIENIMKEEKL